jgi:transposase-like protein
VSRPKSESIPWHTKAVKMYSSGKCPAVIARKLGVTREGVRQVLIRKAGYKSRDVEAYSGEIVRLYKSGLPVDKIAASVGKSFSLVSLLLKRRVGKVPAERRKEWYQKAIDIFSGGKTMREVSEEVGVDYCTVKYLLKKFFNDNGEGIKRRETQNEKD